MKRTFLALVMTLTLCTVGIAGDIPGDAPAPPPECTEDCMRVESSLVEVSYAPDGSVVLTDLVLDLLALVF